MHEIEKGKGPKGGEGVHEIEEGGGKLICLKVF